jgi:Uma2 family endonuclease
MGTMSRPVIPDFGRPFTVDDLTDMPDDGRRYELIDGVLLVSPAPNWAHQEMALALYRLLHAACPADLRVLAAPFAVQTSLSNEVQPDVLVAKYADLTNAHLPVAPLLAVEALSPSTKLHDRNTKKAHYERIGVLSYWLLDPTEPGSIEVLELDPDGRLQPIGTAIGNERIAVQRPIPVEVCPARLLDGLRPQ